MQINQLLVFAFNALNSGASSLGFGLATYRPTSRTEAFRQALSVKRDGRLLLTPLECVQVLECVKATARLGAVMAEVGVFRGGSARLIRAADRDRPLHLFDTFAGLPETTREDVTFRGTAFRKGEFACDLASVRGYLADLGGLHFHQGLFPDSAAGLDDLRVSFAHIDVDLYASHKASLEWFYPRLVPGGILLSHDVSTCEGPRRSFQEFQQTHRDPVIQLPGDQAMIVKVG